MKRLHAIFLLPFALVPLQQDPTRNVVIWFVEALIEGFFSLLGTIFTKLTSAFLYFPNPRNIQQANEYYADLVPVFIGLLLLGGAMFLLYMQFFPSSPDADPYRLIERALAGVLLVMMGKWIIGTSVWLTHTVGRVLMPDPYSLDVLTGGFGALLGLGGSAAIGGAAEGLGLSTVVSLNLEVFGGFSTLITLFTFYATLTMRMMVVYSVFGLFPLLIGLWIFDIGPMKYGATLARYSFKACAFLLIFGVVISGILGVGNAVAGAGNTDLYVELNETNGSGEIVTGEGNGPAPTNATGANASAQRVAQTPGGKAGILTRMLAYIGSIWLAVALTLSGLGALISTGGGRGGGGGGGAKPVPRSRSSPAGGSGVRRDRGGAAGATGSTIGSTAATSTGTTASDDTTGGTGAMIDGSVSGDRLEDVPIEDLTLGQKVKTATEGAASSVASSAGRATDHVPESVADSAESGAERFQDVTDSVASSSPARAASWGVEQTAPYAQAARRTAKGAAVTYGKMFAEEDPIRSAKIGLDAMRRSPIGDPRRSNATGSTIDSAAGPEPDPETTPALESIEQTEPSPEPAVEEPASVEERHEIDFGETEGADLAVSDYPRLVEDQSSRLRSSIEDRAGETATDSVFERLEAVKFGYGDDLESERQSNELLASEALDLSASPRNGGELADDPTADEITAYQELNQVSQAFMREHYGDEFKVYRGLAHDENAADVVAQTIDDPEAETVEIDTPSVSNHTDSLTEAQDHSEVVIERTAEPDDVAVAVDHLARTTPVEGELHMKGGRLSADPESVQYAPDDGADDGETQPLADTVRSLDDPETLTLDQHEAMKNHVDRLADTRTTVETQEGAERLRGWSDEFAELDDVSETEAEAANKMVEAITATAGANSDND